MAVPLVGLAADGTIIKSRLQEAVNGAAAAGARALSQGNDSNAQKTAAINAAATFIKLNYPSDHFFGNELVLNAARDITIDLSVAHQRTVKVAAHVTRRVSFLRFLKFSTTIAKATATRVRKDANIVLVLDRSGSMTASGSCGPMKQAAINFVGEFAPARDNIGIISFATSTVVQLPVTSAFTHAGVATAINGISCDGSTSSAAALWTAYDQLVGLAQPAVSNSIVFFTDGEPTSVALNMPIAAASPCETALAVPPDAIPIGLPPGYTGKYIPGVLSVYTNGSRYFGSAKHTASANADGTPNIVNRDQVVAPNSDNCAYAAGWTNSSSSPPNWTAISDYRGIPTLDMFGNSLNTGYKAVTLSGPYIDINNPANGIPIAANAADDAARRIRIGAPDTVPGPNAGKSLNGVLIDSIGLGNAAVPLPFEGIFLERVSNDPRSPTYDSHCAAGLFIFAAQSADIGAAFGQIASGMWRVAK